MNRYPYQPTREYDDMKKFIVPSLISAAFFIGSSLTFTAHAIECGDEIELKGKKVVLDTDLNCVGHPLALTVVGPGTFDMDGYKLSCGDCDFGLIIEGTRARVRNGVVIGDPEDTDACILAADTGRHTIEGMMSQDCEGGAGISLISDRNTVRNSIATNNLHGFVVEGSRNIIRDSQALNNIISGFLLGGLDNLEALDNTVRDSVAFGNEAGFSAVSGAGHNFQGNTAANNLLFGIGIVSTNTRIQRNRAYNNGFLDLFDENADCDDNIWRDNIFDTAGADVTLDPECIQ